MGMLDDKVVLITGACGGIGEAIVHAFAAAGAKLAICDLARDALRQLSVKLQQDGTKVHAAVVDVAEEAQVGEFCRAVGEALGTIDCLVNTVGVIDNAGDVETLATSVWERSIAVNLTSAFLMAKHCAPWLKRRGGTIINYSSVSGLANQANYMAYSVTKAALLALTRSEAIDLAPHGIRAIAICPGSVSTPLVARQIETIARQTGTAAADLRRGWEAQYPTGRFTTPQEVANLTVFLCGEDARNITGTGVIIDGGLTAVLPER